MDVDEDLVVFVVILDLGNGVAFATGAGAGGEEGGIAVENGAGGVVVALLPDATAVIAVGSDAGLEVVLPTEIVIQIVKIRDHFQ